jgi:hypothetical protein
MARSAGSGPRACALGAALSLPRRGLHRSVRWPSAGITTLLSQASPELRNKASAALWLQQIDPMANAGHWLDPAVR